MQKHFSKFTVLFLLSTALCISSSAQKGSLLNNQFIEFMNAFPGNFTTLFHGEYDAQRHLYKSKVQLEGTIGLIIHNLQDYDEKNYVETFIDMPDELSGDECKKLFADWAEKLSQLDFNGARLVEIDDPTYADSYFFIDAKAWQFDNSSGNIADAYLPFTIRLELRDLDMGGWQLAIAIADRDTSVF